MAEQNLQGCRVLVVEDEYLLADDLSHALADVGVHVLGPVASVEDGLKLIGSESSIDAAVLDVNLRGDMIYPVADALNARGVPFAFATGYDQWSLPERFSDAVRLEKPLKAHKIAAAIGPMLRQAEQSG